MAAAASEKKSFNLLAFTENDMAELDPKGIQIQVARALMRYPEVQNAINQLDSAGFALSEKLLPQYRSLPSHAEREDLFDWLGSLFRFQADNVRNQREHVVLLLANRMLQSKLGVEQASTFLHEKLLKNYKKWCSFLGKSHNLLPDSSVGFLKLAYPCLYLLIWGEAANLRFMPECLCFIFHNVANELNEAIEPPPHTRLPVTEPARSFLLGKTQDFLSTVIQPIYNALREEASGSKNGTAPHSSWRNYDDMNEFFWSEHCFTQLKWPFELSSDYLTNVPRDEKKDDPGNDGMTTDPDSEPLGQYHIPSRQASKQHSPPRSARDLTQLPKQTSTKPSTSSKDTHRAFENQRSFDLLKLPSTREREKEQRRRKLTRKGKKIGFKVGFVEQRSFWNIFHSFRRLWIAQFLTLQVLITLAFSNGNSKPWMQVTDRDIQLKLLYMFVTWAALHAVQALLTIIMQFTLISRNHKLLALRMVLKLLVSLAWITIFSLLLAQVQEQRVKDEEWSAEANRLLLLVLWSAGVFLLPDVLAVLLFFMPWLANTSDRSDYKLFHVLAWWFHTRTYVGRGMYQSLFHSFKYTLFWLAIFAAKISFSYYLQLLPMVQPTRQLLRLTNVQFTWFEFFRNHNRFVVACLWAPVILIYLMDTQIWFSIFAALAGAMVGLFSHIGEVRNLRQFRLRFPFFASAITFNLLPEERRPADPLRICRDMMKRCMIRYGLDRPFEKLPPGSPKVWKFACLWNCIIKYFREEDLISDKEMDWLKIQAPSWDPNLKLVHPWPLVLLSNEVANALIQAEKHANDETKKLWKKISSNEYMKSAVLETFHSLKHLLLEVLWVQKDPAPKERQLLEASRRLAFFSNSLFMKMPRASSVKEMLAFSVLTPYYNEEVLYSLQQLYEKNEDGINIEFYLQQIFPDEWKNREEREKQIHNKDMPLEDRRKMLTFVDRKWASYRGQTLARTVRGMMYYQRALEVLAHLENLSDKDTAAFASCLGELECLPQDTAAALLKFTFVVACQAYEQFIRNSDPRARDIQVLLQENPSLRIAYVSEREGDSKSYHSVLAKYDPASKGIVKIYEIRLPGPFILGEGKPENQNQAIIFTRGEALQTIDMNQDNYFEEALKVRNLLEEFNETQDEKKKPRILGIREHVFTGSVSSLASFMSAQETSFVTLSQRVLANPLRIRMHYGHPDMFDRLWFLTRGGVSKASKAINVSEDIYAGFNCTLRGGHVTHNEYIQVGKGRDVGLNQITTFEAKISSGNGEQVISRDVYRLGHRLDFFRMFSFYYTTVGFYINSLLVVLAAYAFMWGRVYLGLSGIEDSIVKRALSNTALEAALNEQLVVQIGIFSSLPMIVENSLEWGFTDATWHFLIMQLQLCAIFYTFSLGTKAYYFGRTLLHGGAVYKGSGRSFVVKRENFVTIYRHHSRSHFVKGVELIILLIIYEKYSKIAQNNRVYTLMTIAYWFLAFTWLLAPFLFNPSGFDWLQTVYDYDQFKEWLWRRGGVSTRAEESWEVWWNQQQDHFSDTGFWGQVAEVAVSVRFFLIQYGMVYRLRIAAHNKSILVYLVSWTYVVVAIVVYIVVARAKDKYGAGKHIYYRGIQCFVILFVVIVIMLLVELTEFQFADLFISMLGFLPTGWGLLCMAAVGKPFLEDTRVWGVVVDVARLYELAIGLIVLAPAAVLSWLPGFQNMQTRILFNQAFSRGLQISKLLSGKRATYRGSY